jgi:shikimate dehydrogenase
MDRYVVIGNPVAHSLSPRIHAHFAHALGESIEYAPLLVPEGAFASYARRFFEQGGAGANVTLPFKVDAFDWAQARSERAVLAEAANFLVARGGRVEADNTDGAGLVADLTRNLGITLEGQRVLILGAGGATRGALGPLLALAPRSVTIANRTLSRAQELCDRFATHGRVHAAALERIPDERFDLVINATSSGTKGEPLALPAHVFAAGFAYDMAYGEGARAFVAQARAAGARASDGLGMLVEQAAESYFLWRGRRPETRAILAQLRGEPT